MVNIKSLLFWKTQQLIDVGIVVIDKVVVVKAYFSEISSKTYDDSCWGKKKSFIQAVHSDSLVDSERLEKDVQKAINELNGNGFEVVQITPITSGTYKFKDIYVNGSNSVLGGSDSGGYGYGYSYTDSLMILAKKS